MENGDLFCLVFEKYCSRNSKDKRVGSGGEGEGTVIKKGEQLLDLVVGVLVSFLKTTV